MEFTGAQIGFAVSISVLSFVASIVVTGMVLVRLPADYFTRAKRPLPFEGHPRAIRIGARVGYNLVGLLLIFFGILMSLPGVPGQGVLTILLGVMLVDLPGKRRLETAIVRRRFVHGAIDRLRARFHKPPIEVPEPHARQLSATADSARCNRSENMPTMQP